MTAPRRLALDLDGCLCDFNSAFLRVLQELSPNRYAPLQWTQHPPVWFWMSLYGWTDADVDLAWSYVHSGHSQFWAHLKPLDFDALKDLKRLQTLMDVHFITVRQGEGVEDQTRAWLRQYGLERYDLHFTGEKVARALEHGCDTLIDDNPDNLCAPAGDLQQYLIHRPYNATATGAWQRACSVSAALRHRGVTHDSG